MSSINFEFDSNLLQRIKDLETLNNSESKIIIENDNLLWLPIIKYGALIKKKGIPFSDDAKRAFGFSKSTGFSITRLRTSQGKSNQKYISKFSDDEKIRNKIENNVLLKIFKITLNYSLSFFGVGDSLKVSYIKK